jgi:hypothetical protein
MVANWLNRRTEECPPEGFKSGTFFDTVSFMLLSFLCLKRYRVERLVNKLGALAEMELRLSFCCCDDGG